MKNIIICLHLILILVRVSTAQFELFLPRNEKLLPDRFQNLAEQIPGLINYFDEAMLDSFILEIMNQYNMPGLAACALNDGQVVWHNNYCYANIAQNKPVTDSTLFIIASISKTITATALMQLWEQGLFQLNDDINLYLPLGLQVHHPQYPHDPITFEMLLTHTSGIHDNWPTLNSLVVQGDSPIPLDSFLIHYLTPGGNYYNPSQNFQNRPGTQELDYCNVGYALLGLLVKCISGIPFPQFCQQNIFTPLNMNHASWFLSGTDTNNVAMPYVMLNYLPVAAGHTGWPAYPSSHVRISTLEFANFLGTFMQRGIYNNFTLLDSTTIDEMLTRRIYGLWGIYYGFGWFEDCYYGPWLWGHTGGWIGCMTEMFFHPTKKYGFISFTNCDYEATLWYDNFWIINGEICQFAYLWDKIYPIKTKLLPEPHYMRPGIDSLQVTTRFVNHGGDPFNCQAVFISTDNTYLDSIPLFDDGLHGDGGAGDGLWGNYLGPIPEENYFEVRISTDNQATGEYFLSEAVATFTTVGPLVVNHYEILQQNQNSFQLRLYLKNEGSFAAANDVRAHISTSDTNVTNIVPYLQLFGDIEPTQIKSSNGISYVYMQNNPTSIDFSINISSEGWEFWIDTIEVVLDSSASNISTNGNIPWEYTLYQNYPNPFNPSTTIEFDLPKTSEVTLKIFNILGEEVTSLVSNRLSAGSYSYEWDGSNLASGVYLYRLKAGNYIETRKMVLMK